MRNGYRLRLAALTGCLLAAGLWPPNTPAARGFHRASKHTEDLLQVDVHRLIIDPSSNNPVVLLTEPSKARALFIGIGINEARAIYSEMEGAQFHRPLTHDLLERIIRRTHSKIERIIITKLEDSIYYATIEMRAATSVIQIDARPSDSIVLALKFDAPIYVSNSLFVKMALPLEDQASGGAQYGLVFQDLTPSLARYFSYTSEKGVLVSEVRKGSQAEKDGFKAGDIVAEVGGQRVEDVVSFNETLARRNAPVKARVHRKNQFITLTINP